MTEETKTRLKGASWTRTVRNSRAKACLFIERPKTVLLKLLIRRNLSHSRLGLLSVHLRFVCWTISGYELRAACENWY